MPILCYFFLDRSQLRPAVTALGLEENKTLIIENEDDFPIELITENYIKRITKFSDGIYILSYEMLKEDIYKSIVYDKSKKLESVLFLLDKAEGTNLLEIGQETHYDTLGNVVKVIDHRHANKYPICFKEALHIVEKKKAKRDTIVGISREIEIKKSDSLSDTLYVWNVFVDEPNPKNRTRLGKSWYYCINAKTGRLIRKKRTFATP